MSKILQIICLFGVAIISTSCGDMYQNPPKNMTKVSLLRNSNSRTSVFTSGNCTVEAIDNKAINYASSLMCITKEILVSGGYHNVVMCYTFNRGFGNGPFVARCDLDVNFKPGIEYVAKGRVDGSQVAFWIENSKTFRFMSKPVKVPYSQMIVNATVPILIPLNL